MEYGAKHILVNSLAEVVEIMESLDKGISFEELAMQRSLCPSKANGGDLGIFQSGQMVPEFEEAVANMEVNTISKHVLTQFGYHLIKRTA
jgi:peptidyl-prolyl cis-trans isomerase C